MNVAKLMLFANSVMLLHLSPLKASASSLLLGVCIYLGIWIPRSPLICDCVT